MSLTIKQLGSRGDILIKGYELLRLKAYKPTPNDVWTIGFGSTHGVHEGMVITLEEAAKRFIVDTASAVRTVNNSVNRTSTPLTQSMFDALVSLVFNAGEDAISSMSTIGRALSADDYFVAWAGFALWRKQKGKDLLGLARRRAKEMDLFFADGLP